MIDNMMDEKYRSQIGRKSAILDEKIIISKIKFSEH